MVTVAGLGAPAPGSQSSIDMLTGWPDLGESSPQLELFPGDAALGAG